MSLFDDLLPTKPGQTGSGKSSGQQDDPLATATPIIISVSTPLVSTTPEIVAPVEMPLEAPEAAPQSIWDNSSILISTDPTPDMIATPVAEGVATIEIEPIPETPVVTPSPLFDMSEPIAPEATPIAVEPVSIDTSMSSLFDGAPTAPAVPAPQKETETLFHDTNEYIDHAIDEVSSLITSIDAADSIKLAEEAEYRKQKEHYAELELQAETEHKKILEERSHAEKMKKYLEKEQANEAVAA